MHQRVYIGVDSIENIEELLQEYGTKKVLLVRGKGSYEQCGAKEVIAEMLKECDVVEYFDFEENPKLEDVHRGLELLVDRGVNLILAVGGGSVMDMAKLIRFFYSYKGEEIGREFEKVNDLLPLIAMPTTAGTGAEATHFAVMYKDKVKYSVAHADILPDIAIVYPPFTYNNPKYLTACTGFDALAQAIEAWWNKNATEESDGYAVKAIEMLYDNLPLVVNRPTEEIRNIVSEGSYWAGRAINIAKTTAPHAFSYPFTTHYGYPHGHAVALTFPFFMEYNYGDGNDAKHTEKMNKLYTLFRIVDRRSALKIMREYLEVIGLGLRDKEFSIDVIIDNVNLDRLSNNPVEVSLLLINKLKL